MVPLVSSPWSLGVLCSGAVAYQAGLGTTFRRSRILTEAPRANVCALQKWSKSFVVETEVQILQRQYRDGTTYEDWLEAADKLDDILTPNFTWKHSISSRFYDYRLIQQRLEAIHTADRNEDVFHLAQLLQFGLIRNLGNITDPKLFNRLYAGTKLLIENYVESMVELIDALCTSPWSSRVLGQQQRMDLTEHAMVAHGKTALVLQGGSIFGLYHIGVMRALLDRGLLPRIILGTSTGAIMAALAAIHTDEELPSFLSGHKINLDAFAETARDGYCKPYWFQVLYKRAVRYWKSGFVLDYDALERCVQVNVGDMTFQEAFERTGRVVSIAISSDSPGTPNCLNYQTAPHVLIRSAALASHEMDPDVAPSMILEKDVYGAIRSWALDDESQAYRAQRRKHKRRASAKNDRNTPLYRICELFNVNHFIVSQARPYMIPFLAPSLHRSNSPKTGLAGWWSWQANTGRLINTIGRELEHRLNQLDILIGLPRRVRRFVIDEKIPAPSLCLVPEVELSDFSRLLRNPTKEQLDHWITLGEKSVWPCVSALEVRCKLEFAIDRAHEAVRRRALYRTTSPDENMTTKTSSGHRIRTTRARSGSAESNPV